MMYNSNRLFQARRLRSCLTGIIVLLILLVGIGFFAYKLHTGNVITVDSGTTLFIDDCSGYVHIHADTSTNQVVLQNLGGLFVFPTHAQDSDTIIINGCNLDMTVPANINLNITADEIDVFGVSGQMKLTTNGGAISLVQDTLKGTSVLDNNGGPILFQGSLANAANTTFSSNGGSIDISLPGDASFQLKTTGILGTLTTNYAGITVTDTGVPNTTIGNSPQATLTLDVNDSDVVLHRD